MTFCNSRVRVAHTRNYTLFQCFCFFQNIFIYLLSLTCTHCFICLFVFRCAGSSLLQAGFLWFRSPGTTLLLQCTASPCGSVSCFGAWALGMRASVAVVHRFSCSWAYGMFPGRGLNPSVYPAMVDSSLCHLGSQEADKCSFS